VVLLHVAPEIIKDANEVAIQIGGHKLAQLPRFVLGLGNDLRLRGLPLCEEFVHLRLAVEIEPEKIVGCGFVDVGGWDFRDRSGERNGVVGFIVAGSRGFGRRTSVCGCLPAIQRYLLRFFSATRAFTNFFTRPAGRDLSIWHAEVSLTKIFDRPLRGREFFEEIIRDNMDLGRPDRGS
jgi:hypothetical protein